MSYFIAPCFDFLWSGGIACSDWFYRRLLLNAAQKAFLLNMADNKVSLAKVLQGQPTENGSTTPKNIARINNPGYSPVLVTKVKGNVKQQGPEYMEMGVANDAYMNEELPSTMERNNTPKLHTFSSTKKNPELHISLKGNGVDFDEDNYLTPTKSTKRPPISPVGEKPSDPQYEELNEVSLKIGTNHLGTTSTDLPKRKTNMLYEPADIKKKSKKYEKEPDLKYSEVPCWLLCGFVVIGLVAVLAVVLCGLLISGTVKANKDCECKNGGKVSLFRLFKIPLKLHSFYSVW